ncbi:MAG: dual specificity protein phosphatase, partial [Chloroflexota bacterium]
LFGGSPRPTTPESSTRVDRVAPWLYIGPALTPEAVADLPLQGVTHVLDLREEASDDPAVMEGVGLRWRRIPIQDRAAPTDEQLDEIIDWLDKEADSSTEQAVYVHCHAGMGRTPTIAIALLMQQQLSLGEARRLVFAARPEVAPTQGQMDWLERLDARLAATRPTVTPD